MKLAIVLSIVLISIIFWIIGLFSLKIRKKLLCFSRYSNRKFLSLVYLFLVPFISIIIFPLSAIAVKKMNSFYGNKENKIEIIEIYKDNEKFGYKKDGKPMTLPIFEEARVFNDNYAIVKKNGLYGLLGNNGKFDLECLYNEMYFITEDILWISKKSQNKSALYSLKNHSIVVKDIKRISYIDEKYKILIFETLEKHSNYNILYIPNSNICAYTMKNFDFIDNKNISYTSYREKESGIMDLQTCKKTQVKTKSLVELKSKVIKGKNLTISVDDTKCSVKDDENKTILRKTCNEMYFDDMYPLVYASIIKEKKGKKYLDYEIYNVKGKKIINTSLEFIAGSNSNKSLNNKTLAVKELNGKYGLINIEGKILLPFKYSNIYAIKKFNFYIGRISDYGNKFFKTYLFSQNGKILLDANTIYSIQNNIIKYKINGKVGLVDFNGKAILKPQYEDIIIQKGKFIVQKNLKWGIIDSDRKILIHHKYDYLSTFKNKLSVFKDAEYWGYIDENGKEIFRIKADYLSELFINNTAILYLNNKSFTVVKNGDKYEVK